MLCSEPFTELCHSKIHNLSTPKSKFDPPCPQKPLHVIQKDVRQESMEKNIKGKGELQLVTRKYQKGNITVPLTHSALPKFMFITSDALKERDFQTVTVGKRFVTLTAASRCKGLVIESAIQLQQVVGRKQQTQLRRRVRQSWEH